MKGTPSIGPSPRTTLTRASENREGRIIDFVPSERNSVSAYSITVKLAKEQNGKSRHLHVTEKQTLHQERIEIQVMMEAHSPSEVCT